MDELEASRKEGRQAAQDLHGEKVSRRNFQDQAEALEKQIVKSSTRLVFKSADPSAVTE